MDTVVFINMSLAFLEGLALIVSPCILPLLPVLLAGSLEGSKRHPLGILTGFILVFALFSLFAKKVIQILGIDLNLIRYISFGLLILFGLIMLSGYLSDKFSILMGKLLPISTTPAFDAKKGFFRGLLFGSLIGLVWTPCAGPILAAVIVQTVIGNSTLASFLTLIAFGIGVAVPLLLIIFGARIFLQKLNFFKRNSDAIRKILGIFILIGVILMIYADKIILWFNSPLKISSTNVSTPASTGVVSSPSQNIPSTRKPPTSPTPPSPLKSKTSGLINGLLRPYPAPPLADIHFWINTKPIEISDLKGKVVLVDFWAYSCINCIRTLPYLKSWYQKYKDQGLVIIGVHTPEFEFEQDINNVRNAVRDYGIEYPVVLDNLYSTWRNYQNQYWPASYLINQKGEVVYTHFGEGNYDITEANIRTLLGLPAEETKTTEVQETEQKPMQQLLTSLQQTPETYLGYERSQSFASPKALTLFYNRPNTYSYPATLNENKWALKGTWTIFQKSILANQTDDAIQLHFYASKVYAVMGSRTGRPIQIKVLLDGKPLTSSPWDTLQGKDVNNSMISVSAYRLYDILNLNEITDGKLELIITEPGVELFTFTFGGN